jgi:hypothetical protein
MENGDQSGVQKDAPRGFFSALLTFISDIFKDVASSMLVVLLTFCFATAVTAGMLWLSCCYFGMTARAPKHTVYEPAIQASGL